MVLVTVLIQGSGLQWRQGQGLYECALAGVSLYRFISVIREPRSDRLLSGFVWLQHEEAV